MDTVLPDVLQCILSWSSELDKQLLRSANKYLYNLILKAKNDIPFLCAQEHKSDFLESIASWYTNRVVEEAVCKKDFKLLDWCITNKVEGFEKLAQYAGMYGSRKMARYVINKRLSPFTTICILGYAIRYTQTSLVCYYKRKISYRCHYKDIEANSEVQECLGEGWQLLKDAHSIREHRQCRDVTLGKLIDRHQYLYRQEDPMLDDILDITRIKPSNKTIDEIMEEVLKQLGPNLDEILFKKHIA